MIEEKASDFLDKYTVVNEEGKKQINMVAAVIELYARLKSAQNEIRNLHECLGDYGQAGIDFDNRLGELEGKKTIEVVSEHSAKQILKG